MRRRSPVSGRAVTRSKLPKSRRLKLEALEPRLVLTSLTLDQALGQLSGHGGMCSCPVCTGIGLNALVADETAPTGPEAANPLSSLPVLHSNPSASAKLFLDFDGHFESSWGSWSNVNTPAFDQDGDTSTFSDGELASIYEIWARVSEDYSPFNIDVTTVDPGNQTNGVTAVIAIGGSYSNWYGTAAGGVAYVGGFANGSSNVGYVFENDLGSSARYVAEASSHESGHLFGLRHQSVWSGGTLVETYNSGNASWAPIMGNSYSAARSTWYNGTTNVSSTSYQDDMAIIAGSTNGFGQKADDYGNTIPFAANLPVSGTSVSFSGLVAYNSDVDMWVFTTAGGQVNFTLDVAQYGANLDAILELRDASNNVLASSDPSGSFGASITATVGAGTFYLVARGNGVYGNVGQYTISGTVPGAAAAPEISVSVSGSAVADGGQVSFGSTTVGTSVLRTLTVTNDGTATLTLSSLDPNAMPAGYTLTTNLGSTSLAPGASTTFTVRLDAAGTGTFAGEILLASNDANENPYNISLTGDVAALPEISAFVDGSGIGDGVYIDYGTTTAGSPITKTFTIRNDGGGTLNLTSLDPNSMPAGFTLTSNLSSLTLTNGQTATFTVRLNATSAGSFQGQIQVASNDSNENPFHINLLGGVTASPEITLTESGVGLSDGGSLGFGTTTIGSAVTKTFTVTNDGNATLTLTSLDPNSMPAGFTLVSNLGSTSLAAGASTTFTVRLDAASAGTFSGTISLGSNDANENPFDVTISGTVNDPNQWSGPKLMDDGKPGWTKVGSWTYVTGKGRENDIYRTNKGSGSIQANWTFTDLPDGEYWVWASWTGNKNNASNAPFTVYDGTQAVATWRVDQRTISSGFDADGTSWKYLGMVAIHSGRMVVRLTNSANGFVVADAIRMDKVFNPSGAALPGALVPAATAGTSVVVAAAGVSSPAATPTSQPHRSAGQTQQSAPSLDAFFARGSHFASVKGAEAASSLADHLSKRHREVDDLDWLLSRWGELEDGPLPS
jgi:trimeric autotransporter adhesin